MDLHNTPNDDRLLFCNYLHVLRCSNQYGREKITPVIIKTNHPDGQPITMIEIPTPDNDKCPCIYVEIFPKEIALIDFMSNIQWLDSMWTQERSIPIQPMPTEVICKKCGKPRAIFNSPCDSGFSDHAECDYPWFSPTQSPASALGSIKSDKKTVACRDNAKKPRPNAVGKPKPRKPKS